MSSISQGPLGAQPSSDCVLALETCTSMAAKLANQPKCSAALSGVRLTSGSPSPSLMARAMAMNGTPETSPLKMGPAAVDYSTGTTGAFAIASALFQRMRTGLGQRIDLAMFDTALMLVPQHLTAHLHDGSVPRAHGNGHRFATNRVYDTSDGQIVVAATNRKQQRRLWEAMARPEFATTDRGVRHRDAAQLLHMPAAQRFCFGRQPDAALAERCRIGKHAQPGRQ